MQLSQTHELISNNKTIFGKGEFWKKCRGYHGGLTNNYPTLILRKIIYVLGNLDILLTIIKRCMI